tara:strand:+ start:1133 stop:1510 length:378 start_codon:yes stop_codon:yes gene_type:complete
MSDESNNGWQEWSRHVLAELNRLNDGQDRFQKELADLKVSIAKLEIVDQQTITNRMAELSAEVQGIVRSLNQPDGMIAKDQDFEQRLRAIETYNDTLRGKLSVVVFIVSPLLALLVSLVSSYIKG